MLNIVLFEPEIAENVGNIIRTCVAFNAKLHMIRPYGFPFSLTDKKLIRSSANYLKHLQIAEYDSYDDFIKQSKAKKNNIFYLTRYGTKTSEQLMMSNKEDIYLMFGKESTGIDKAILKNNIDQTFRIPISENTRALNISNCVSIMAYEYVSANKFKGLSKIDPFKKL